MVFKKLKSFYLMWRAGPNQKPLAVADGAKEVEGFDVVQKQELLDQKETHATPQIDVKDIQYCTNCQTPLSGSFCGNCGQKNTSFTRPIWFLLADLTEDIISKDSKLFRTIGHIIFWPGSLTRDFMDGKRARFIPPIRFYLLCTLVFFITLAVADVAILKIEFIQKEKPAEEQLVEDDTSDPEVDDGGYTGGRMGASRQEVQAGLQEARAKIMQRLEANEVNVEQSFLEKWTQTTQMVTITSGDDNTISTLDGDFEVVGDMFQSAEPSENAFVLPDDAFDGEKQDLKTELDKQEQDGVVTFILDRTIKALDGIIHVSQDPRRLNSALNDWLSKVMIFLLPFFAIILRLFYWKRENCLMKQLVFSLHFHSAVFLMMTFLIISQAVWGAAVSASMFYAIVPLYLFIAMKVASRQGIIRTTFKFFMVSIIYLITLSITVALTLMISFSEI